MDSLIPPYSQPIVASGRNDQGWWSFFLRLAATTNVDAPSFALLLSYPVDLVITGVAATAIITISAHTRRFPGRTIPVNAGQVTGRTYGVKYWVYYDDPQRSGNVTYAATTVAADAFASAQNPSRFFVGSVTMPANPGAANTTGDNAKPPGYP